MKKEKEKHTKYYKQVKYLKFKIQFIIIQIYIVLISFNIFILNLNKFEINKFLILKIQILIHLIGFELDIFFYSENIKSRYI